MPMMALHSGVTYGPIQSRRLGLSLGVNLLPPDRKVCSFNCAYCQYGWTAVARPDAVPADAWPGVDHVLDAVDADVRALVLEGTPPAAITLAGHGEPTLHPAFEEVARGLRRWRDAHAPGLRLAILSNSTTVPDPRIRAALALLDDRCMKLDAADPVTMHRLNGSRIDPAPIVAGLASMDGVIVQALFAGDREGRVTNLAPAALDSWVDAIARIRPRAVDLYTLDRPPAWGALRPATAAQLGDIAARVEALGLEARVIPPRPQH
jgi:wyosine [tRNA(Phe)-imidazoG37] synthetase (radical SAM superfamily)